MSIRILCLVLLLTLPAAAADRISRTLVITNAPIGNTNSVTWNGSARTFTNTVTSSPATLIQETNTVSWTATNILNHFTLFKATPGNLIAGGTNFVRITGGVGENPTLSINACCWGFVTNSTQTVASPTFSVRMPITVEATSNRTTIAGHLTDAISDYSTSLFDTNSTALGNFLTKGASPLQGITSPVQMSGQLGTSVSSQTNVGLYNATNRGYVVAITNGYWTNAIIDKLTVTNFSSPGTGTQSEQFGNSAAASGNFSMAVGVAASSAGSNSLSIGRLSSASGVDSIGLGQSAVTISPSSIAIGTLAELDSETTNSIAFGAGAFVGATHVNAVALGAGATTTKAYQIRLGTATETNSIPGALEVAGTLYPNTITNHVTTGTNKVNARVDFTSRAVTGLANGYNDSTVNIFGTNVYVRFSGPSGAYTNAGFLAEQDGSYHIATFDNPGLSFTILDESGLDSAANRILTGTGALMNSTNRTVVASFLYDLTAARWRVISFR